MPIKHDFILGVWLSDSFNVLECRYVGRSWHIQALVMKTMEKQRKIIGTYNKTQFLNDTKLDAQLQ